MNRYDARHWLLAAALSMIAGYVDAIGFLKLGGLFVSFMSGNSTRMAVGSVVEPHIAFVAARLLAGFVAGVIVGTMLATVAGRRRKPVLLGFVGLLLAVAASLGGGAFDAAATTSMTAAMGAANTVFQRDGEVSIGVTYMTGTLVKFGQRLTVALMGGPRWQWLPYLALWSGLVGGAVVGALVWSHFGMAGIWLATTAIWLLVLYACIIGPAE